MRIVVTGGAGFIGSSFVNFLDRLNRENPIIDIIVVDKLTYASNIELLPSDIELIEKDICDITKDDLGEVTHIVNFAAETHVDNSIKDGSPFIKTNVMGTFNLLEVARQMEHFEKFVQISTDEVYGDLDDFASPTQYSKEGDILKPSSYYSASKASADQLVMSAGRTYGLPYLITRTCNNYGKHQHSEKFIPKLLHSIDLNFPFPLYGDGEQIREWIWVEDNVEIIFSLMISDIGIWNIGTGDRYTNREILRHVSHILGRPVKYESVPDRLGHDRRYGLNIDKLNKVFPDEKMITINLLEYLRSELV
jgi:dTDP-glucose 4,6-dehydratase